MVTLERSGNFVEQAIKFEGPHEPVTYREARQGLPDRVALEGAAPLNDEWWALVKLASGVRTCERLLMTGHVGTLAATSLRTSRRRCEDDLKEEMRRFNDRRKAEARVRGERAPEKILPKDIFDLLRDEKGVKSAYWMVR